MIRISCTNCHEVLTIDDAFAGGVCRCQHCGTIQTVPAAAAAAGGGFVATGGPNLGGARVGSGNGSPYGSGTGLDDLAGAVASSGLSSRRLLRPEDPSRGRSSASARATAKRQNLVPLFVAAGAIIVVLVGVIVWMATRPPTGSAPSGDGTASSAGAPTRTAGRQLTGPAAANFCGTPLTGDTVIYVLDRGTATQDIFAAVKDAAYKSAASLGSDHHFQIVFWSNAGEDPVAYPTAGTAYATKENVDAARHALDDLIAFGLTEAKPAVALALRQSPDLVVLATATAKGWALDDAWAQEILTTRGAAPTCFDTFSLGGNTAAPDAGVTPPLKTVADKTGGVYAVVSNDDLRAAAE